MYITEERILIAPNDEQGRAFIDKMCEAYRLSGTAYSREDTTTAISLKTLCFINVSTKYGKMADALRQYCKSFTDCSGCEFYLDGCTIYGVPSEWEVDDETD